MRVPERRAECYIFRNQVTTARGSNLTQGPILKHGMRPAFASFKHLVSNCAAPLLLELYATKIASAVVSFLVALYPAEVETGRTFADGLATRII
jgi:hypothetical protein